MRIYVKEKKTGSEFLFTRPFFPYDRNHNNNNPAHRERKHNPQSEISESDPGEMNENRANNPEKKAGAGRGG